MPTTTEDKQTSNADADESSKHTCKECIVSQAQQQPRDKSLETGGAQKPDWYNGYGGTGRGSSDAMASRRMGGGGAGMW